MGEYRLKNTLSGRVLGFKLVVGFASAVASAVINANPNVGNNLAASVPDIIEVPYSKQVIQIDGELTESVWENAKWYPIDQLLVGVLPSAEDFQGQYTLAWKEHRLYLAAKIVDDRLMDQIPDPKRRYWDDDCLEIFIDEDKSGGDHQENHNAFAYHLALDNQVADIDSAGKARLYNAHALNSWKNYQDHLIWEVELTIYDDSYQDTFKDSRNTNTPVVLAANKDMGFMLAYCDNDNSNERESFIGSHPIVGDNKNLGWQTADVFGAIKLLK